jgi:hypothetical protein
MPNAAYVRFRRVLVEWVIDVFVQGYSRSIRALVPASAALNLVDRYLQSVPTEKTEYQLVACACILISSKVYFENPMIVDDLHYLSDNSCSIGNICDMERDVLNQVDWDIMASTAMHFVNSYCFKAGECVYDSDMVQIKLMPPTMKREHKKLFQRWLIFFGILSLHDYTLEQYSPSIVASAIIMCARKALNFSPEWNSALEALTKYTGDEIQESVNVLWAFYTEHIAEDLNSKGEGSDETAQKETTDGHSIFADINVRLKQMRPVSRLKMDKAIEIDV